jgi:hypothetical protein
MTALSPAETEALLDRVAGDWARLGVFFRVVPTTQPLDIEDVICRTAAVTRADERVFVCAASWLAIHHAFVNGRRLSALVPNLAQDASAVLGALLALATSGAEGHAPELEAAIARCRRIRPPRPLFRIMDQFRSLRERVKAHALPIFEQWGFWHDDTTLKPTVIRPVEWLLGYVPELRCRALLGPSVEADIVAMALAETGKPITVRDVALTGQISYAAAHAAATRLVQRGVLYRERSGVRQLLWLTPLVAQWFETMARSAHRPPARRATAS